MKSSEVKPSLDVSLLASQQEEEKEPQQSLKKNNIQVKSLLEVKNHH